MKTAGVALGLVTSAILLAAALLGCVAGGGYGGDVGVGYGVDFYEPFGYDYGGWGRGYRVGPPRGGPEREHAAPSAPRRSAPAYHPAAAGRSIPSIPTHSRGR